MELAGIPAAIWGGFLLLIFALLALDLGVFHRHAHVVRVREALVWTGIWVSLALVFNLLIFLFWDRIYPGSSMSNAEASLAFFTGFLVEKALSIDNIFVFLMVFGYFAVPPKLQHRVLFWGILGALLFRAIFIGVGSAALKEFAWMTLLFGAFLIVTGFKMVIHKDKKLEPEKNPVIKLIRKLIPVTNDYNGSKFFLRINGKMFATPLFVALVFIEITDIVFAVDSIPAIFAITDDPFIVFTSNVFAILGLRALFFALSGVLNLFHYLGYGLAAVLVFVGGKMAWTYSMHTWLGQPDYKFPIVGSLGIILVLLLGSVLASILFPPKGETHLIGSPIGGVDEELVEDASDQEPGTLSSESEREAWSR